ncbi:DNA primase/polymerase [Mycobacterium phage Madruga]|uniref:DNA primase/polymerase n=1 Tax=Mycobacterium phage Madruga TaxID=1675552 RepID=A0A0K1LTC9_9CAUD|nr:DNA primase/polymerase [Mycobacterium phage Madruga]
MSVPTVMNPYRDTATKYYNNAWFGPLILPYKMKEKPPSAYTGRMADYPQKETIKEWINDGQRHNICIRLAGVDKEHEIIGIDVDDYWKGDKKKDGGEQLQRLVDSLGPLPDTWISSARTDGTSGIRYYRVPRGLAFRGKADKDIEIIQKRHRYAIVWPSIHPDGGTYWWFPPGIAPDKNGKSVWDGVLPDARQLPLLPDSWIEFLSNNRLVMPKDGLIDMDTPVDSIYDWATETFHGDDDSQPCTKMREKLDKHIMKIKNSSTFHDLLVNAHWNILNLAFEGHVGWNEAINELEQVWANAVAERGGTTVRDLSTLNGEIFRSRIQALRQIKAKSDDRVELGAKPLDPCCLVTGACGGDAAVPVSDSDDGTDDPLSDVPQGAMKGVPDYETNDDGNAQHFVDMFSSLETGPAMRYAEGAGWMVWHKGKEGKTGHWELDPEGDQVVRRMWQKVKKRQSAYADACFGDWQQKIQDFANGQATEADVKAAKARYDKWNRWSEMSGNNRQAENAIKATRSIPGVSISVNSLDRNPFLLGVANGVVELGDEQNIRLRTATPEDLITLNTNQPYEQPSKFAMEKWQEYLNTFLPDPDLQRVTQIAMGHCLIGGNPEKILIVLKGKTNTGKSTMISAIESAIGDYAKPVTQTIFQNHKLNPALAYALTKRIIVCSEFDEKDALSASQVKRLTGGSDKISAELKGSNTLIEGVPQFVPILATNEVPSISGADKALENRLYVIPFNVTPQTIDKRSAMVIEKVCGVAVLNWLIEGYRMYRQMGELPRTNQIKAETADFMSDLDPIAMFAHECIERVDQDGKRGYIKNPDMYLRFNRWWTENEFKHNDKPSQPLFTKRMRALGYIQRQATIDGDNGKWWFGVGFKKTKKSNVLNMPNLSKTKTVSQTETGDLI